MERLRLWIQTLSLAGLALAALLYTLGSPLPAAQAAAPPTCQLVDSGKLLWDKAGQDIVAQAQSFLAQRGDREHIAVIPFGRMGSGSGGFYSILCAW